MHSHSLPVVEAAEVHIQRPKTVPRRVAVLVAETAQGAAMALAVATEAVTAQVMALATEMVTVLVRVQVVAKRLPAAFWVRPEKQCLA
ncbi:hypothetical protein [Kluyvera ascorbata]